MPVQRLAISLCSAHTVDLCLLLKRVVLHRSGPAHRVVKRPRQSAQLARAARFASERSVLPALFLTARATLPVPAPISTSRISLAAFATAAPTAGPGTAHRTVLFGGASSAASPGPGASTSRISLAAFATAAPTAGPGTAHRTVLFGGASSAASPGPRRLSESY